MKIGELSKETGASIRSIRHYEKQQLITAARQENGYREFNSSDIERIKTIQNYLALGMTTSEIKQVLDCQGQYGDTEGDENCEKEMQGQYEEKLDEIKGKIDALTDLQQRLEKQIHKTAENGS
ncbi:MerR family transcriptional regulator [Paenibacillaceae bacterium WGS1546]|uniref:MerR family transcriptional regulator n=1 Tax=Cohnella sp. WGS1546 TaxID=3366810 RepID=UPI00372D29C0